jgi:hypothetical protein
MRRYLALQAMESGKSMGNNFLGRAGGMPYGSGMLLNTDASSSKVGKQCLFNQSNHNEPLLTISSHPPFRLSLFERWKLETSWPERHGSCHLLLTREVLHHLLYQQ